MLPFSFLLLERDGAPPLSGHPYLSDTLDEGPGQTAQIRVRILRLHEGFFDQIVACPINVVAEMTTIDHITETLAVEAVHVAIHNFLLLPASPFG